MKKGVVVEKLKRRAFTAEFKVEAVKLVTENGLSCAEVGRRLDVLPNLIKTWENTYLAGKLITGAPRLRVTAEQMDLSKLRKEVQDLKMERDILKNAPPRRAAPLLSRNEGTQAHDYGDVLTSRSENSRLLLGGLGYRQKTWFRGICEPICGGAPLRPRLGN